MWLRPFIFTFLLIGVRLSQSVAQPTDSTRKAFSIFPFPIVYYTPETRFAYGAVVSATFRFRRDLPLRQTDTSARGNLMAPRPSNVQLLAAYTQNKQLLLFVPFQVFYDRNKYYIYGEAGYYTYTYNFYGIGQKEVPSEQYGVNYPRIRLNALRRVRPGLYAGLRAEFEDYAIQYVEPAGLLASGTVPGGGGGRIAGAGLGLFYDTRDQVFFPTKGVIVDLTYLGHSQNIFSNFTYSRYVVDLSSYHKVNDRAIVAFNYVVSMTGGVAPFSALSLAGSGKRLRGYYEGRYRDDNLALFQAEARVRIWKRLSAVVFGGVGVLGNSQRLFRANDPKAAYGGGLRLRINNDGLNIRADYGIGKQSSGLYLTLGEAF
ncbi:BamA/TamA family outer membrane protein [Spirosoma rigui]|uniref:BamA/TamA family outer membrane protein n=1 Tax=Spirosoma rigui TaxID=564064 RepID=UPI0009AFD2EA|nr:BamA/TamA family outer membrane protein [Spirosoma rigui]